MFDEDPPYLPMPVAGRRWSWRLPSPGYPRVAKAGRTLLLWTRRSTIDDPPAKLRIVRWPAKRG